MEVDTKLLKKAMVDNDINTIEELVDKTGVNRNTLSDVVNGRAYPSSKVMVKLKMALCLTQEEAGAIFFKEKFAHDAN